MHPAAAFIEVVVTPVRVVSTVNLIEEPALVDLAASPAACPSKGSGTLCAAGATAVAIGTLAGHADASLPVCEFLMAPDQGIARHGFS